MRAVGLWFCVTGLVLASSGTPAAAGEREEAAPPLVHLTKRLHGREAITALGDKLPAVAAAHRLPAADLSARLERDADLWVDTAGRLVYYCAGLRAPAGAKPAPQTAADGPVHAPVSIDNPPIYHSKPGAPNVIYLDFNGGWYGSGYAGSAWGGPFNTYAFDTDGDTTTFSDAEQVAIKRVWQRVAEDYSPFNVDVTTDPAANGTKSVILFTQDTCANGVNTPAAGYGGIAYVGVFGNSYYWPAWVSTNGVSFAEQYMAEAGSHEMGHNLSLYHDGTNAGGAYYWGHGSGDIAWAPIMGAGYNGNVTQWSKGEYYDSTNTEDDLNKIQGYLTYRTDDCGNTNGTASPLVVTGGTTIASTTPETDPANTNPANKGIIERNTDVDVWRFATAAGSITLNVNPWISPAGSRGGNLDLALELRNSTGALVASADPPTNTYSSIATTVAAGTYYLHIKPVGAGTPLANPPSGYTVYGSLGEYFISGTVLDAANHPPVIVSPAWADPNPVRLPAGTTAHVVASDADADPLTYAWSKVSGPGTATFATPAAADSGVTFSAAGTYVLRVTVADGNGGSVTSDVTVTVTPNHPPVITGGASVNVTMSEDGSPTAFALTLQATDADGDPLTWAIATAASHGTATAGGTGASQAIGYVPNPNYYGTDSFVVQVADGQGGTDTITVNVTIQSVNDVPTISVLGDQTIAEDGNTGALAFTIGDVETPAASLTLGKTSSNTTLVPLANIVFGGSGAARTVTVTPTANESGTATITVTVTDGAGGSATETFLVTVTAVNDAPVALARAVGCTKDKSVAITLTATDADGDGLTYSVVSAVAHGTLTGTAPSVTYTPAAGYLGADSFTFKANDGTVDSAPATVSITVKKKKSAAAVSGGGGGCILSRTTPANGAWVLILLALAAALSRRRARGGATAAAAGPAGRHGAP